MEISWSFGSWVPLVSKFCPYDNYKIWKKGSCIRMDTTLIGFENLQWIRGDVSFLFSENLKAHVEGEEEPGSHVAIVNHKKKKVEFALESFKRYSLQGDSKKGDLKQMIGKPLIRMQLLYDNIIFSPCKSWFGYSKQETVGMYTKEIFTFS